MKTQYLINETPLMVLPSLMKAFNGNYTKALILQQVHFMCSWPKSGVEHDGERWVWFTYDEFAEQYMPWTTGRNVRQNVRELEKDGLLLSTTRIRDSWDNTKFYRVDESAILRMVNGDTQDEGHDERADVTSECQVESAPECQHESTPECQVLYTDHSSEQGAEHRPPRQLQRQPQRRRQTPEHMRAASLHGLEPRDMTRLVNAVLDATGKRALADTDGVLGDRELSYAQECAVTLLQLGVHSPEGVADTLKAFRAEYPKFSEPSYRQLCEVAGKRQTKAQTPRIPSNATRNADGSVTVHFVPKLEYAA